MGFVFLYIIIDVFSTLQDILKNHPSGLKILELYVFFIPTIITQTSPIATLLATLFTLGHLNQSNEIIAMRASGMSIFTIIKPILACGFIISLGVLLLNEIVVPYSQSMTRIIKEVYIEQKTDSGSDTEAIENVAVYGFNNRLFFINKLYTRTNTIEGLTILEHDSNQNVKSKIYAELENCKSARYSI